jgi:hypothetical protein
MGFTRGKEYQRSEIGLSDNKRAVLVEKGRANAIVVTQSGVNPYNHKKYENRLTGDAFIMQGENDSRGALLEQADSVDLFFLHTGSKGYRYEGKVRHVRTTDYAGEPWREFERLPDGTY